MNIKKYYLLLFFSTIVILLPAQSYDYRQRAAQVRAQVWAWENPEFKNYAIPDEMKNESAVILARHRQIEASANKSTWGKQFFYGNSAGELFYTDIDRRMILINDKNALAEFSEFSFKEEKDFGISTSYYSSIVNYIYVIPGARIIKPDGSVKEIDVSKSSVAITEGRNDREAYKKLAIPELQINDILDFFICEIYQLETYNIPEQFIPFYSFDYPALHNSCSLTFGKNLTIEYRSINGAPQLSRTTDSNGNTVLTAESSHIMRINDYENIRWQSPLRDLPLIRFVLLQNASKAFYKPPSARPLGVHENVPYQSIIEDTKHYLNFYQSRLYPIGHISQKARNIVYYYKKSEPSISKEKLANIIYSALNFEWRGDAPAYFNSQTFILILKNLFVFYEIPFKIGFITSKYSARKDEVLIYDDFFYMIVANSNQYFFPPYRYRIPGEIPANLQGETVTTTNYQEDYTITPVNGFKYDAVTLPETSTGENNNIMHLQVSFNPMDMQKIDIKRHAMWIGDVRNFVQPWLLLYEDWDNELRRFLKIEKSYVEELYQKRKTRDLASQVESNFEKSRKKFPEKIETEIKQYHGITPDAVKDYSFSSLGVTMENPQLEYEITYTMNDFVRYAGKNIILDAGKLIGQQWNPTENERNRNIDAYIPTRRSFESEIVIQIPDNYLVGNIEHLNVSFSNEYATFEAACTIENNTIVINTKKAYLQTFIHKDEWYKFIEILDKTNRFYSSAIIFQKKYE